MIVINPTKEKIEVDIAGTHYVLPAEGQISGVREEHALYWKGRLHSFLEIRVEAASKAQAEAIKEVVEAAADLTKKPNKK